MQVHRIPKHAPGYTILDNGHVVRKHSLSWAARGLLSYLLSLPDGAREDVRTLAAKSVEGRTTVARALRELEAAGHGCSEFAQIVFSGAPPSATMTTPERQVVLMGGSMTGIEDVRPATLPPCPSCGNTDEVVGVPAVYHAGRETVRVTTPARRDESERTETRLVSTSLSGALAPGPDFAPSGLGVLGVFLTLVSIGTFVGWVVVDQASDGASKGDHSLWAWISLAALLGATAVFVCLGKRRSRNKRVMAGRPAAEVLWSQGLYCRRCGTVHLRTGHPGQGRALSLREFRWMVWEAGGYADWADRQPA